MSDDGIEVDIPENRTAEMLDILENTDGKAIIWAAYGANVQRITAALQEKYGPGSVARFWGGNAEHARGRGTPVQDQSRTVASWWRPPPPAAAAGRGTSPTR